jgi:hypothetical protein
MQSSNPEPLLLVMENGPRDNIYLASEFCLVFSRTTRRRSGFQFVLLLLLFPVNCFRCYYCYIITTFIRPFIQDIAFIDIRFVPHVTHFDLRRPRW